MEWLLSFLQKHMEKSVLVILLTSALQLTNNLTISSDMANETLHEIAASSSGLQAFMLMVLYFYLKYQK
jgi:hypothetical protein